MVPYSRKDTRNKNIRVLEHSKFVRSIISVKYSYSFRPSCEYAFAFGFSVFVTHPVVPIFTHSSCFPYHRGAESTLANLYFVFIARKVRLLRLERNSHNSMRSRAVRKVSQFRALAENANGRIAWTRIDLTFRDLQSSFTRGEPRKFRVEAANWLRGLIVSRN